jgi:DNA-binding response OmpR family regulator
LPGLSGWEVAAGLRVPHGWPLQILMLSANSEQMHGPEFRSHLHDDFLIKPVEFAALADAIGGLLDLTWIKAIAQEEPAPRDATGRDFPPELLSPEAAEHTAQLRELLQIGHVRGMEEEIRKLQPDAPELAHSLFDCLDRFDLGAMSRILDGLDA